MTIRGQNNLTEILVMFFCLWFVISEVESKMFSTVIG